jgi:hypothetical protein
MSFCGTDLACTQEGVALLSIILRGKGSRGQRQHYEGVSRLRELLATNQEVARKLET